MEDVWRKLRFKGAVVIINVPADLSTDFSGKDVKNNFDKGQPGTNTLVFLNNHQELVDFLAKKIKNIVPDSILWLAYPKGTSKIKTDINRDTIHVTCKEYGLKTVAAISVNDTWSALRLRPLDKVGT